MKKFISPKEALQGVLPPNEKLRYLPLYHPDEIRLVKVLPGSRISPVKCELQPVILGSETPKYVALSYCWGDATNKTWINCNGQRLALTKDLLNAIRRLRRKDKTETLWIDQVCINQEDLQERSDQVQLMRKIYEKATNVFIWLGDEADESNTAIKLIPRLLSTPHAEDDSLTAKEWRALKSLLSRPWFSRMWVLQELGVASSAAVVYGNQTIPWQDVSDAIHDMQRTGLWYTLFGDSGFESSLSSYWRLVSLSWIRKELSDQRSICSLKALSASRHFNATDPRDKIYALTGLCMSDDRLIQPDYSKNVLDVYRESALAVLFPQHHDFSAVSSYNCHAHSAMEVFSTVESTERKYALPSWVPEWREPPYLSLWDSSSKNGYKAAGTSETKIGLTDDPNKISLAGKIGDAVHLVTSIAPAADDTSYFFQRNKVEGMTKYLSNKIPQSCWINESSYIAANCQRYQDNAARDAAFASTLVANATVKAEGFCDAPEQEEKQDDQTLLYYWHFRQFLFKLCPNGVVNGAGIPQLVNILRQHMDGYEHFRKAYMITSQGRRFFTTLGGYMGIGPPGMRAGDMICVFLGGNVPWVIRQEGSEYTLVGECYVHGIMKGEIMQTPHLPVQDLIIK